MQDGVDTLLKSVHGVSPQKIGWICTSHSFSNAKVPSAHNLLEVKRILDLEILGCQFRNCRRLGQVVLLRYLWTTTVYRQEKSFVMVKRLKWVRPMLVL